MLQHEIAPFAQANRVLVEGMQESIERLITNSVHLTSDQKKDLRERFYQDAQTLKRSFDRFEVCALDEWKQKLRYEKYAKENGYPYS